jgi:hypothetical protein
VVLEKNRSAYTIQLRSKMKTTYDDLDCFDDGDKTPEAEERLTSQDIR